MPAKRLLAQPTVARLAMFARCDGPAVFITTEERLEHVTSTEVFGVTSSVNPELGTWSARADKVIITFAHALKPFPTNPDALTLTFTLGQSYPRESLLETLVQYGFERDALPGFVVRGDTISIYTDEHDNTTFLQLSFFGDELDGLMFKEQPVSSHQLTPLEHADIDTSAWSSRLLEHLKGPLFLDASELFAGQVSELASDQARLAWFWEYCQSREVISFGRDDLALPEVTPDTKGLPYYRGKLEDFANDAEMWLRDGYSVNVILRFERTGRYLRERVIDHLESQWAQTVRWDDKGMITLSLGHDLRGGFLDAGAREVVITEDLLYAYQGATRKHYKMRGQSVGDATQLAVGDYLVHPDHGIGLFLGLEPRQVVGVTRDYLILKYAAEGKLYLPVEQLPMLRRHPGTTDSPPKLSTLGTNEWSRARERARTNAQELAMKLIKVYAERQLAEGFSMGALPTWDERMDDTFAYELTPDQETTIAEVYGDMSKVQPMDRLVSGDVGFGKTEVAIRAANRAVGHQKQVAVMVPTTVLAKQHYETFFERFKDLPVSVEVLSRFTSDKEAKSTIKGLKTGSVDIIIGTHRLLSEDITFKDLGLLIIDEEHRFGVAQKERMKGLKANLDILSLSATPIPRTLYMSLVGLRDVSQIMTPPEGRKPIQTVLQPYNPNTIRSAVLFELERGGKAFYIHDRIGSMGSRAMMLKRLVPEARIGVAHGQMSGEELERVMVAFEEGAYDLLLSTTIVENGLDIATANTLIIERADRLGLAQLYQLRGRVGRRQTEAWAYLLYPGKLTDHAQKRLYAIAELNDLGSGHLLAERDMEIRGVGNLLGPEQHGHVSAVSLEVYTEMLAEEVAKLKGQAVDKATTVSIDLPIDARLSPSYVADDEARITYYGRLSEARGLAEIGRIRNELRSNYGPFPPEVQAFLDLAKLRIIAQQKNVLNIREASLLEIHIMFDVPKLEQLDYDTRGIRNLPYTVEPTQYPPGFSLKKRGLKPEGTLKAIQEILYQCA